MSSDSIGAHLPMNGEHCESHRAARLSSGTTPETLDMLGRKKEALALFRRLLNRGEKALADGSCGEGRPWARSLTDCLYRIGAILEEQNQRKRAIRAYKEHLARRKRGAQSIYPLREVVRKHNALLSQLS